MICDVMFDSSSLTPQTIATHASALSRVSKNRLALAKNNSKLQSLRWFRGVSECSRGPPLSTYSKGRGGKGKRSCAKKFARVSPVRTFAGAQINSQPAIHDKAKPRKELSLPMAEHELKQQSTGRRDRDLGADCLERRSVN
eukprot:3290644-Pleurochrysis_carterae.AAC.1